MALIKCPECGKEVSDQSKICIHCGYPLAKNQTSATFDDVEYDIKWLKDGNISWQEKMLILMKNIKEKHNDITSEQLFGAKDFINKYHPQVKKQESRTEFKDVVHCPKCNSTAITTGARGVNNFWGLLGASKTVNRCGNCGYTWKPNGR